MKSEYLPRLAGFLSDHESEEKVVDIKIEPDIVYFEEGRDSLHLNFDFILKNLTEHKITIRFIKMAVYDKAGNLLTYRHVNHNGIGTPGIHTIGKFEIEGYETLDIFNPFHRFPRDLPIAHLRYMFTLFDSEGNEYYYGNILVTPKKYKQEVRLFLPMKGVLTILDGHDFYSHHRRFAMTIVRQFTDNKFKSNFSRFSVDFSVLGEDGNTRSMTPEEYSENYDFHFRDAREFYTDGAEVYAPADGEVIDVVSDLEDLYESRFDMDKSVKEDRVKDIAGNYVIIKHNEHEFSHLFHLMKDSIVVSVGERVRRGQLLGKIGFSGAATTYSHLHYQLMDGPHFLVDKPLPCKFTDVDLLLGSKRVRYEELSIDTGDIIISE
ncbi:MAG: peptidoglycan DD-metalloendopeptidase family protein [Candidatus Lokiarchaeota archaeon]|nr:peptidoglycan DD-metalloendopeptidase family protein [Candidatus Lokiarchaeota archaeon]